MCYTTEAMATPGPQATPFDREIEICRQLAAQAGQIALEIRSGPADQLGCREKSDDQGPVTEADLRANALIVEGLQAAFSTDMIVAEESPIPADFEKAPRCWFIDPIDGTSDFAAGRDCWAVHIGLCIDGRPALGLVYEPEAQRYNFGVIAGDLRCAWFTQANQHHRIKGLPQRALGPKVRAVVSASHRNADVDAALAQLSIPPENTQMTGSTGVKSAIVARGEAEVYLSPTTKTKYWDSCAPQALVEAAGGTLSGLDGQPIDYRQRGGLHHPAGLLATAGVEHDEVVQKLAPMVARWLGRAGLDPK